MKRCKLVGCVQRNENENLHTSLVLGLAQQRVDPAAVTLNSTQRTQVSQRSGNHAGNAGDRLKKDDATQQLRFGHSAECIARANIERDTYALDGKVCQLLVQFTRWLVLQHTKINTFSQTPKIEQFQFMFPSTCNVTLFSSSGDQIG